MSDYQRGSMNIEAQRGMYDAFMGMTKWGTIFCAVLLILMAIFLV